MSTNEQEPATSGAPFTDEDEAPPGFSADRRWVPRPGGVRVATYEKGSGPAVLMINGLGACAADWGPAVEELAKSARLITFDNRGVGRSDLSDEPLTLDLMAEDAAAVLDAFGLESAHVVGYSMGGMIAQILAARHPERVDHLVLMATHPGAESAARSTPRARAAVRLGDDLPRDEVARARYEAYVAPGFARSNSETFERMIERRLSNLAPVEVWRRQLDAIRRSERSELVREIRAPTLILHGRSDPLIPYPNGEMLEELVPDARLVAIAGCGHMVNWESPREVVAAVRAFLDL